MGRQKLGEFKINNRDKQLFQALAKTGAINKDIASEYLGLGKSRLDRMVTQGYLVREEKQLEVGTYYKLSDKGKTYVKNNIPNVNNLYKATGGRHDLELCKQFLRLHPAQRDACLTEADIRDTYGSPTREEERYSVPDLYIPQVTIEIENELQEVVKVTLEEEVIEVVTPRGYTEATVQQKYNYTTEIMSVPKERITEIKIK